MNKPLKTVDTEAYKRYLIVPLRSGGFSITKDNHCIQHFTPSLESAKEIIDVLA